MMAWRYDSQGMTNPILLIVAMGFFGSISTVFGQGTPSPSSTPTASQLAGADVTYKIFFGEQGYGYDIFLDGKKLIHQPNIPGRPGAMGFKKKEDSQRVAELVIKKIKKNQMPPTITEEELRQLKVIE